MPPTLILVRHAEALHNMAKDYSIPDPVLSDLGHAQCRDLKANLKERILNELDIGLIIVSPMVRTIETALLSLPTLIEKGVPIIAHAGWQENSAKPCDTGSPLAEISARFPQIDFSQVDPVFPDKTSPAGAKYWYTKNAIVARGQSVLAELYDRPEKVIVVVSHSGFLRLGVTGHFFMNADYRIFDYEERNSYSKEFKLKQWESTKAGGLGWSWDQTVAIGFELPEEDPIAN